VFLLKFSNFAFINWMQLGLYLAYPEIVAAEGLSHLKFWKNQVVVQMVHSV